MRQRNHALTLRLNDEELKHLKDQVVASGLTTQTFLRLLIAGQKIKPRRPEVFIDLLHELSAIGNNINQIARVANTCGYVRQSDLNEIKEMQSRIWQKVKWMSSIAINHEENVIISLNANFSLVIPHEVN